MSLRNFPQRTKGYILQFRINTLCCPQLNINIDMSVVDESNSAAPIAKLAAVTKKKNSLEEILHNYPPNESLIRKLYNDYLLKVEALYVAADEGNFDDWLAPHKVLIDEFRNKIQLKLSGIRGQTATTSRSARSVCSFRSAGSSSSSVRIRLAERRAKAAADRKLLEKSTEMEQQEMNIRLEQLQQEEKLKKLQLQKKKVEIECAELENEVLEAELNSIDRSARSEQSSGDSDTSNSDRNLTSVKLKESSSSKSQTANLIKVLTKQSEISNKLSIQQEQSTLPKQHISTFDGSDTTEYKIFRQNFSRLIEAKCSNDADKLCYLEQYTAGAAQEFVKSCVHSDPCVAYREAKLLLDREYGNEYKVAAAYLKTLNEWPIIKSEDASALQSLYTYLLKCHNYLESSSPGNQINNPQEIMNIVCKLPHKMKDGWRRRAFNIQEDSQPIRFRHLVEFVGRELRVMKQPLFGVIVDPNSNNFKQKERVNKNFVTLADANENSRKFTPCECCKKENH